MKLIKRSKKQREQPSPLIKKSRTPYHSYLSRSKGVVDVQRMRIYKLARMSGMLGESVDQLAVRLGVPRRILGQWMHKDKKIIQAIQAGLDTMIVQVEMAGIKRARGYEIPKVERVIERDITGKVVRKTVKRTTEHVPPDSSMIKFLLSKRMRKRYQDERPEGTKIIINMDKEDQML